MAGSANLARVLEQTLNPQTAKIAEQQLKNEASMQPNFLGNLLNLIAAPQVALPIRQAAALFFKNFVRQNWKDDEQHQIITPDNRNIIKSEVVALVAMVPPILQLPLGDTIGIIADTDFYKDWLNLVPNIVSRLDPADLVTTNAMLQIAHSVFKRWRPKFRTDELFSEIKYVLDLFCQPYLALFQQVDNLIAKNEMNQAALKVLFDTLQLLLKLYVDLNCQDIPEFFEDNMTPFMAIFHKYLTYHNPLLATDDDEGAGPLEKTKANICEIIEIYTKKYEDVFPMLPDFVNTTWTLLTTTGLEPKYDILVSKAMALLTSVVTIQRHSHLFSSDDVLRQIVEKIVLPNMTMRTSDEELFEDDPLDYIRRDLEGSDSDTRRRSASDFVRGLIYYFEKSVTLIVQDYINHYLAEYSKNPSQNWRSKDTALFLFSAIAIKSSTAHGGVTSTNILVDVCQFWTGNAAQEFTARNCHPVLQADYIRYVYVFRNQLRTEQVRGILPTLVTYLSSQEFVVYTYAAVTLERILLLKREEGAVFTKTDLAPLLQDLLGSLFTLIEKDPEPEKLAENDFLMRCVMRVMTVSRDTLAPFLQVSIQHLLSILAEISKNPSNPRFNHYLFECIAALIRFVGPTSPENLALLESTTVPQLLAILSQGVEEFMPYVFQILSQLLESQKTGDLSEDYLQLLPPLINPDLWRTKANTIPLVRLLQAYLRRGATNVVQTNKLQGILGVWQNLISSRLYDGYGFDLLMTIFLEVPMSLPSFASGTDRRDSLQQYVGNVFHILLTRLQKSRTDRFVFRFIELIYFLSAVERHGLGPSFVQAAIEQQGPGLFGQLLQMFIIPKTAQIKGTEQVIVSIVGITRILTENADIQSGQNARFWPELLTALIQLRQAKIHAVVGDDDIEDIDIEESGFQATYTKLAVAGLPKLEVVPFKTVDDAVKNFVVKMTAADSALGGALFARVKSEIPAEGVTLLRGWGLAL